MSSEKGESALGIFKTLERLCLLSGPSGFEGEVADAAQELLRPLVDETFRTRLGSVVGVLRCGREHAPRLLLDAHLDEVGIIVTGEKDGFLRFRRLGGVDPRMLYDREITLMTRPPVFGVVACLPPHVQTEKEMDKSVPVDELYLDVGLSHEEAARRVPVGTPGTFRPSFRCHPDQRISAKALDDRAGVTAVLRALELIKKPALAHDVYVLFSTQEETSSAGAITAVEMIRPDVCLAVDVTHGRTPDAQAIDTFPLGAGPTIGIGPNAPRRLAKRLAALAEQEHIKYQMEVLPSSSGTNAWPIQIAREGVLTGVVSIPLKYMHTPIEMIHSGDLEAAAKLLSAFAACPAEVYHA